MNLCTCYSVFFEGQSIKQHSNRIYLVEAEVEFEVPNLRMCKVLYGFYILYGNNADIPFSCAYLASLVLSRSNLPLSDEAYT